MILYERQMMMNSLILARYYLCTPTVVNTVYDVLLHEDSARLRTVQDL